MGLAKTGFPGHPEAVREFNPEPPRPDPPRPEPTPSQSAPDTLPASRAIAEQPEGVSWLDVLFKVVQAVVVLAGLVAFYLHQEKKAAAAKLAAEAAPVAAPAMLNVAPTAAERPAVPSGGDSMAFLRKEEGRMDDGMTFAPPPNAPAPQQNAAPQEQPKKKKWEPAKLERSGGVGMSNFR